MEVKSRASSDIYYSATASSLNKRPIGEIASESDKKKGKKSVKKIQMKHFSNIGSRIDTGMKKEKVSTVGVHQSDGLTAKRKDELFGRLSGLTLANFLSSKYNQATFMYKLRTDNQERLDDKGTDFNYADAGYKLQLAHSVRINKRPITAYPGEKFGNFTSNIFSLESGGGLKELLNLQQQNVILLDMRGEGNTAFKEFADFHI